MYGSMQKKFKWLSEDHEKIKKCFNHKASNSLKNAMSKVRSGVDKGKWIPTHVKDQLDTLWHDPAWMEKAKKNTQNRKSEEGLSIHSGVSIPAREHKKRLVSKFYYFLFILIKLVN